MSLGAAVGVEVVEGGGGSVGKLNYPLPALNDDTSHQFFLFPTGNFFPMCPGAELVARGHGLRQRDHVQLSRDCQLRDPNNFFVPDTPSG